MIPLFSVVSVFSFLSQGNLSGLIITAAIKQNSKTQKQWRDKKVRKAKEEVEKTHALFERHGATRKGT